MTLINIIALAILSVFSLAGFAAIFFTTFGTLIILIGAMIYAVMTGFQVISLRTCGLLVVIYFMGEMMEYISVVVGSKKFGASNAAIVGAIVGAVPGALIGSTFFGIGIFIGTLAGIFFGAFIVELVIKKDVIMSLKAGTGGILGRLGSIAAKIVIAFSMLWITARHVIAST